MPRFDRLSPRRALFAGAACLLATLSCGREVTGPAGGVRLARGFAFEARFGPAGMANGVATTLVPFTKVRVVLVNTAGASVVDQVVDFPSTATEVPLSLDVPLSSGTGSAGEAMSLALAFVNAAGDTVFRGGPLQVQVVPKVPGTQPPPAPQIPVTFTGTGAAATRVVISRSADSVLAGNAFSYTAVAQDAQGNAIPGTPIAWRSETPTRATITAPGAGTGTTLATRGPALIIAQLLSAGGQADTVFLEVLPRAQGIAVASGSGQTALVGAVLPAPVVVRVTATDGQPMAGVTVNFAAANGGSVGTASTVSNASGLAQTTWTLGAGVGSQSVTATATGLAGSPLTFTAIATAPVLQLIHHYPFNTDLNDIVGTDNGTFGGTNNAIANQVLAFGGLNGFVQYGSQIVPNTGSYSVSFFVRNRTTAGLAAYISQGAASAPGFYIGSNGTQLRASDQWLSTGEAAPPADGVFHHLTLVVDSIGNQSRLYVDGTLKQTLAQRIATPAVGTNTRLGRQFGILDEYFDGDVDELRIYTGALDAAQVAALYTAGPSAPGRLVFGVQPTTATAGTVIAPAITVRVEDALGRLRTSFSGTVTLALDAGPNGATLGGTTTQAVNAGIATFSTITVSLAGAGYRLRASSVGSDAAIGQTFTASPASATQLVFTGQPTGAVAGQPLTPAVVVTALDAQGNVASGFTGNVTLALASNPGSATLSGTVTVPAVAGVATFTGLSLNAAGAGYTLSATAPGLVAATSAAFSISASAVGNFWINPAGGTWSTASNWSLGRVPVAADTVVIAEPGTYTVTMDVNFAGSTMLVGGGSGTQTLAIGARTLTMSSLLSVQPTGAVTLSGAGTIGGTGTISNQGTITTTSGTVTTPLLNAGTFIAQGTTSLSGALSTVSGSLLQVLGSNAGSAASLTVASGFSNSGTIELTTTGAGYNVQLNVTTGTLTNASTGTITTLTGAGGARTLAAQLNNQGAVLVPFALTLARASAAHVNSGTITTTGTADLTVTQTGTTPSFTNTGTITLAGNRSMAVSGGTLDLTAGLVAGYASFLTTAGTPTVRFSTATVQPRIGFASGTVLPDPFVIPVGDSLRISTGTFAPPSLTNNGLLVLESNATVTTAFTTGPGSVLRVRGTNVTNAVNATITNAFTNAGAIELVAEGAGYNVQLNVPTGTLTNASTGTITSAVGAGGARTLAAQLNNQGAVLVPFALTLARASAAHVNSGTITTTGTADLTVTQTGTTPSFTNTGTITLAGNRSMAVSGGTLDLTAGLVAGYTSFLTTTGAPTVRFSTATVQPRIGFAAGTVLPDPFVIPVGDSLRINAGTFAPPSLTNNGLLALESTAILTTALTTGTGSVLRVRGNNVTNAVNATITNAFTNTAAIELVTEGAGYTVQLNVPTGTLTNASTGTISSLGGAGGSRTLAAQLNNQGAVLVPFTLTLARASAAHVNSGTITMTSGADLLLTQTGTTPSFTNTGTITLSATRTWAVSGGTLDLSAGLVAGYTSFLTTTGAPTVRFTTATVQPRIGFAAGTVLPDPFVIPVGDSLRINAGTFAPPSLTNNGLLALESAATLTTAFTTGPGSVLRVRGTNVTNAVNATITNAFTNTGAIELVAEGAGYNVQLNMPTGTLTNASTGTITSVVGAGGLRTLVAQLNNQGAVVAPFALTLARASAAHVNSGTITMSGTADLTVTQSGTSPSFTNTGTITLAGSRTMAVSGGTLDLSAGLVAGYNSFLTTTLAPTVRFTTATVQPRIGFSAGTVLPDPFVIPVGDSLRINAGNFAPPSLTNNGLLALESTAILTTALTTGSGSVLRVRGTNVTNAVNATITNAFTNTGAIELVAEGAGYNVQLNVPTGTLTNASTGTITSVVGAGGLRTLAAQLSNQGSVLVPFALTLARASAAHVNSGTITTTGTADLTVTQTGTAPSFTNTGTITLAGSRSMVVSGGTLNLTAGLVAGYTSFLTTTGAPTVRFTTATVQPRIGFSAGTVLPDPFVIPAGDSLRINDGTFAPPSLTNNGWLVLEGTATVTTALTTGTGSVLRVRGTNVTNAVNATITNGFTNAGAMELVAEGAGYNVQLNVPTGTLTNASTGTITSAVGAGGARTLAAQLNNQGAVLVPFALTLARASAAHVNTGTITTTGTADLTVTQTGTAPSFTNAGTITLAGSRTMAVSGGTLDLTEGLVAGYTSFLTTTGAPTVRFATATVQPRIGFAAGTVLPDPFEIPAGDSLRINAGTFAPPSLTNNGLLVLESTATLNTALTTGTGSVLRVRGTNVTNAANATITNGFTNNGILELTTEGAGYNTALTVATGALNNAVGGTVRYELGAGGSRTLTTSLLDNFGTFTANFSGTIAGPVDQRGTLTVAATRNLTITGLLRLLNGSTTTVLPGAGGALTKSGGCTQSGTVTLSGTTCP